MAFVMAASSQGRQREATEMDENELALASEIMDFEAEKQAADTPNVVNMDFGKEFHHWLNCMFNCMMFPFQVDSHKVFVPFKLLGQSAPCSIVLL